MPASSSMPSGSGYAPSARSSRNALMGDMQSEHSGKPGQTVANILAGGVPSVAPAGNALAAGVAPPPPPPPPVASAAPAAPVAMPAPAVPPGQERHAAVGKVIGVDNLSDADLKGQSDRYEWVRGAIGRALQQPDLSHADVVQLVADGVRDKAIPSGEASKILGDLPTEPAALRDALQQRQVIAVHGLVHMASDQQRRAGAK